jgi:molybdate transport system substrate-binding protein
MSKPVAVSLGLGLSLALAGSALAEEVRVYAAGAAQHVVLETKVAFERASGHVLIATFGTVGALRDRIVAGETADATILSTAGIAALEEKGFARAGQSRVVGATGPAIAHRAGAAKPDISTPEALKATLLATRSIAYGDPSRGATAGIHFAKVLEALGIAEAMKAKTHLVPFGVEGIERVAKGESELAVSQATEILANPGVGLAGALPPPYRIGTSYAATVVAGAKAPTGAAAYVDFLLSPAGLAKFRASGFVEP